MRLVSKPSHTVPVPKHSTCRTIALTKHARDSTNTPFSVKANSALRKARAWQDTKCSTSTRTASASNDVSGDSQPAMISLNHFFV